MSNPEITDPFALSRKALIDLGLSYEAADAILSKPSAIAGVVPEEPPEEVEPVVPPGPKAHEDDDVPELGPVVGDDDDDEPIPGTAGWTEAEWAEAEKSFQEGCNCGLCVAVATRRKRAVAKAVKAKPKTPASKAKDEGYVLLKDEVAKTGRYGHAAEAVRVAEGPAPKPVSDAGAKAWPEHDIVMVPNAETVRLKVRAPDRERALVIAREQFDQFAVQWTAVPAAE